MKTLIYSYHNCRALGKWVFIPIESITRAILFAWIDHPGFAKGPVKATLTHTRSHGYQRVGVCLALATPGFSFRIIAK